MSTVPRVAGAHLVGSVSQPTARDAFAVVSDRLGAHLERIPDGEVGERFHWMLFQGSAFEATEGLVRVPIDPIVVAGFDVRPFALDGSVPAAELALPSLGYADAAIASYAEFSALRGEGVVACGTRFQVCVPTPLAPVTTYVAAADRPAVYPVYEEALAREVERMAAAIPAEDLSIQLDLATEFAYIEGVSLGGGALDAWFAEDGDVVAGCVRLAARIADRVPDDIELGIHLCYGDVGERHFTEPGDAANLVAVANGLVRATRHPLAWFHLPVPIERTDAAYAAPLSGLHLTEGTALYAGLVHIEDGVEGAMARIAPVREALGSAGIDSFGIGTECGFGRGPRERTVPLLDLHAEIIAADGAPHGRAETLGARPSARPA